MSNKLKMGIVGLPNVGKSSTFNLISKLQVKAENSPFSTIDPNEATVQINDERFDKLVEIYKPKKEIKATLNIFDIAGLVPDAHLGYGLGNSFLSHILAVDGIYHMVRAFSKKKIIHTEGEVDPVRDLQIISHELVMKDKQLMGKRLEELDKKMKNNKDQELKRQYQIIEKAIACLDQGKWIKDYDWSFDEIYLLNKHPCFTAKNIVYLVNISKKSFLKKKSKWLPKIKEWVESNCKGKIIPFSVEYEQELAKGFIEGESYLDKILKTGYETLNLIHFFTVGKDEVRCWTVRKGSTAPEAAGVIHSDFREGFINAQVFSYEDLLEYKTEKNIKANGKLRTEGKSYIVKDGDIILFKFHPPKKSKKEKQ